MISEEIAKTLIQQMNSHIDLLFTLSMAMCGAIAGGIMQILVHNSQTEKAIIRLHRMELLYTAFLSQAVSLGFGYLARGSVTAVTPIIFKQDMTTIRNWTEAAFEGHSTLRILMIAQFLSLLIGVLVIFVFARLNKKVLLNGGSSCDDQDIHNQSHQ